MIVLAASKDAIELKKRGFEMRLLTLIGTIHQSLEAGPRQQAVPAHGGAVPA